MINTFNYSQKLRRYAKVLAMLELIQSVLITCVSLIMFIISCIMASKGLFFNSLICGYFVPLAVFVFGFIICFTQFVAALKLLHSTSFLEWSTNPSEAIKKTNFWLKATALLTSLSIISVIISPYGIFSLGMAFLKIAGIPAVLSYKKALNEVKIANYRKELLEKNETNFISEATQTDAEEQVEP